MKRMKLIRILEYEADEETFEALKKGILVTKDEPMRFRIPSDNDPRYGIITVVSEIEVDIDLREEINR